MLRTHRAGRGAGGCAGWGLVSRNGRGPGVPPTPELRGRGPHLGAQQASWARVGGAVAILSSPAPPVWEGPSRLPLLISLASLLCPQDPRGLEGWGAALEGRGLAWELSSLPGLSGQGDRPLLLSRSSPRPLPPASPDLPSLRGADPVWPPLLLPTLSPYILLDHLEVPPVSLGISVPHQQP